VLEHHVALIQVFLTKFPTDEHGLLFVYKELYVMYHVNSRTFDNIPNQQEWAIVSLRSLPWENLMTCSFTDLHTFFKLLNIHKETHINSYSFEFAPERYKFASQQEDNFIPTRWVVLLHEQPVLWAVKQFCSYSCLLPRKIDRIAQPYF
jgi:hypothetical protein